MGDKDLEDEDLTGINEILQEFKLENNLGSEAMGKFKLEDIISETKQRVKQEEEQDRPQAKKQEAARETDPKPAQKGYRPEDKRAAGIDLFAQKGEAAPTPDAPRTYEPHKTLDVKKAPDDMKAPGDTQPSDDFSINEDLLKKYLDEESDYKFDFDGNAMDDLFSQEYDYVKKRPQHKSIFGFLHRKKSSR